MQKCQMHTSPSWCEFVVLRFFCFHDKKIYNTTSYLHEQQFKIDYPSLPPCNMGLAKLNVKSPPIVWTPYTHTNDLREGGTNMTLSLRSQHSTKLTLNLVPHSNYKHLNSTRIIKPSHDIATCHYHIGWDPVESHAHRFMGKGTSTSESTLRTGIKDSIPFRADEEREDAV